MNVNGVKELLSFIPDNQARLTVTNLKTGVFYIAQSPKGLLWINGHEPALLLWRNKKVGFSSAEPADRQRLFEDETPAFRQRDPQIFRLIAAADAHPVNALIR